MACQVNINAQRQQTKPDHYCADVIHPRWRRNRNDWRVVGGSRLSTYAYLDLNTIYTYTCTLYIYNNYINLYMQVYKYVIASRWPHGVRSGIIRVGSGLIRNLSAMTDLRHQKRSPYKRVHYRRYVTNNFFFFWFVQFIRESSECTNPLINWYCFTSGDESRDVNKLVLRRGSSIK